MIQNKTIIISCAGMGKRLGKGVPKALVEVAGKSIIRHQLEMLKDFDDIRVVIGYQAELMKETISAIRPDVKFYYNFDYESTGTAASFCRALPDAREFAVALDGDLLVNPDDLKAFLDNDCAMVGGCTPTTDNPVLMTIDDGCVTEFSRERGELEWTGLAILPAKDIVPGDRHVYMLIEPMMPVRCMKISTKEIDTPNDYDNAVRWVENGYRD